MQSFISNSVNLIDTIERDSDSPVKSKAIYSFVTEQKTTKFKTGVGTRDGNIKYIVLNSKYIPSKSIKRIEVPCSEGESWSNLSFCLYILRRTGDDSIEILAESNYPQLMGQGNLCRFEFDDFVFPENKDDIILGFTTCGRNISSIQRDLYIFSGRFFERDETDTISEVKTETKGTGVQQIEYLVPELTFVTSDDVTVLDEIIKDSPELVSSDAVYNFVTDSTGSTFEVAFGEEKSNLSLQYVTLDSRFFKEDIDISAISISLNKELPANTQLFPDTNKLKLVVADLSEDNTTVEHIYAISTNKFANLNVTGDFVRYKFDAFKLPAGKHSFLFISDEKLDEFSGTPTNVSDFSLTRVYASQRDSSDTITTAGVISPISSFANHYCNFKMHYLEDSTILDNVLPNERNLVRSSGIYNFVTESVSEINNSINESLSGIHNFVNDSLSEITTNGTGTDRAKVTKFSLNPKYYPITPIKRIQILCDDKSVLDSNTPLYLIIWKAVDQKNEPVNSYVISKNSQIPNLGYLMDFEFEPFLLKDLIDGTDSQGNDLYFGFISNTNITEGFVPFIYIRDIRLAGLAADSDDKISREYPTVYSETPLAYMPCITFISEKYLLTKDYKSFIPQQKVITIQTTDWQEKNFTITMEGIKSNSTIKLNLPSPTTRENADAVDSSKLIITEISSNSVTVNCKEIPERDINILLTIE